MSFTKIFAQRLLIGTLAITGLGIAAPSAYAEQIKSTNQTQQDSIAAQLTFGSGEECPHEPYCLPALAKKYGLHFKDFVVTDPGGKRTRAALANGDIQIGVLFTTNGHLATDRFVLLEDDRNSQPPENIVPIAHQSVGEAYPELGQLLNRLSAALTTPDLAEMNRRLDLDKVAVDKIAADWLQDHLVMSETDVAPHQGPTVIVGSGNFGESQILAEIYTQALTQAGYTAEHRASIGNRATYLPLLEQGEINLFPEYVGSLGGWLNHLAHTTDKPLSELLPGRGLIAYDPAPAEDKNGFVVTAETAKRYNLKKVSDLANPAL